VPQGNGIRRSKDLRAKIRKFLILTNERKQMSTKTLRKRIALTATTALFAGMLSVASAPVASAHAAVGVTNSEATIGTLNGSLFSATTSNGAVSAVVGGTARTTGAAADIENSALSKGLLYKDSSSGIAQSATVLQGATISLYAQVSTASAFAVSGGSLSSVYGGVATASPTYNASNTFSYVGNATTATGVAALWTAPTTLGTYTVSLLTGFATSSTGASVDPQANLLTPPTLSGNINVTVVAVSGGGAYSATTSFCRAKNQTTTTPTNNIDDINGVSNGNNWAIDYALNDAYGADLDSGNIIATATNGALLSFGTAGSTPVAGTSSTIVAAGAGANNMVLVGQGTANAPVTTTVTISYNGTTVCTKTVSIAGAPNKLTVASVAIQDLNASAGSAAWFADGTARAGTFYVVATDAAGNRIATPSTLGTYAAVASTMTTTVTGVTFDDASLATSTSSTSPSSATVGRHSCSSVAGSSKIQIKLTLANGTVINSDAFEAKCADDPYTYTASFDKASYVQGEIATLTASFKDSKGNPANNVGAVGAVVNTLPFLTFVTATGAATVVTDKNSAVVYTLTVGTTAGATAGTYTGIVDFTGLTAVAAVKSTPTYKITTGGDTTSNADVLKSIVALIASINKQIQALQKLILKR